MKNGKIPIERKPIFIRKPELPEISTDFRRLRRSKNKNYAICTNMRLINWFPNFIILNPTTI
jgi:hypothetical protein